MRSAIAVTIAPAALVAAAIGALLALRLAGLGFEGDPHAVLVDAPERLWEVAGRRGPVVGVSFLIWLGAAAAALAAARLAPLPGRDAAGRAATRGRVERATTRLAALTLVYLPLVLLGTAALEPHVAAERLLVALGTPALAALTLAALGGYRALALACAATVLAHAADLVAGSPLTQLSLAGPNPAGGHRFYGVGNELEAVLVVLVLAGTGAALSVPVRLFPLRRGGKGAPEAPLGPAPAAPAAFLVVAAVLAFVFAYGRYGADVGAAISLPLGAAVAAAVVAGRPRLAWLALAVPIPALAILATADLVTGADAHLTGSVLQADGGGDALAVLGDRLRQAGESFGRPLLLALLPLLLAGAALAWRGRARIDAWLRPVPAFRAALAGALAATVVGTVANDSGALLLELGALYMGLLLAYAWAEAGDRALRRRVP